MTNRATELCRIFFVTWRQISVPQWLSFGKWRFRISINGCKFQDKSVASVPFFTASNLKATGSCRPVVLIYRNTRLQTSGDLNAGCDCCVLSSNNSSYCLLTQHNTKYRLCLFRCLNLLPPNFAANFFVPGIAACKDKVYELASACGIWYCSGLLKTVRREE